MSLCTPHERSTVAGARHAVAAAGSPSLRGHPADVQAARMGVVAVRRRRAGGPGTAGARCCWEPRACASTNGANRGVLTTIKSGPHRVVYRVDLPQGTIYIKHFLVPDWRATLRQWVRRGKGRNEGKRSQHLASIGVPTITPVALGEQPAAEVPVRELSRHTGDLLRDPARRVRRAAICRSGPSRSVRRSARSSPRPWPS